MKLQTRITIWIAAILLLSASVTMILSVGRALRNTLEATEHNLLNTGRTIAQMPMVVEELQGPPVNGKIQRQVQDILSASFDIDLIVVCNMDSLRYSHPNTNRIGEQFIGGDDQLVVREGKEYISTAEGSLGVSVRALVPILDPATGEQVGFVAVGTMSTTILQAQKQLVYSSLLYLVTGLTIGVAGAVLLARRLKSNLLGLEPEELARLYHEHTGMMDALHEGVIAIDRQGKISLSNESARQLLGLEGQMLDGLSITDVMPNTRLPKVIAARQAEYDREQQVNGRVIITNRVPIFEGSEVVGAIATFRDKTMLIRLAEDLTGTKQLVESLRASSHEFSNKLHVILGLVELGEYDRAKSFILDIQQQQEQRNTSLLHTFHDPVIAGLMLGKFSASREQGVELVVTPDSGSGWLDDSALSHTLITVIGNFIDNAIESARNNPDQDGFISVEVHQDAAAITVQVTDNGSGIPSALLPDIFHRGVSTKGEERGIGLHLVKREIEALGGVVTVRSVPGETVFTASLPVKGEIQ